VCRSKHVEPLKNFGIINCITKLNLVGISTEVVVVQVMAGLFFRCRSFRKYIYFVLSIIRGDSGGEEVHGQGYSLIRTLIESWTRIKVVYLLYTKS